MIAVHKTLPGPVTELDAEKQKTSGTYRLPSVIEQLKTDFANKCYLCESKAPTSINVEHRIPHRDDTELQFSWPNLFWACGHCNGTKGDRYHPILDCTVEGMRILDRLDFSLAPFPVARVTVTLNELDASEETQNTAQVLHAIHNGTKTKTAPIRQVEAENLCSAILEDYNHFLGLIEKYQHAPAEQKTFRASKIRAALSREAPFTAIKACYIKRHPQLNAEFGDALEGL